MKSRVEIRHIICDSKNLPMLVFFGVILIYHFMANINYGDDITFFKNVLANTQDYIKDTINFSIDRYYGWSGRTIIEIFIIYLSHWPTVVWRVLDSFVWLLLFYSLSNLLELKSSKIRWCLAILMLLFPFKYTGTAGWICTSLNYTWPASFGCYFFSIIKNVEQNIEVSRWQKVCAMLALVYAVNEEQMIVIMLPVVTYLAWKKCYEKQISMMLLLSWIIIVMAMVYSINCPGNESRLLIEVHNRMPDFFEYSLLEKLDMGYVNLINSYFQKFNILSVVLCFVVYKIYVYLFKTSKYAYLACIPLIWSILCQIVAKSNIIGEMRELRVYDNVDVIILIQHILPMFMIVLLLFFMVKVLTFDGGSNKIISGGVHRF